jgi:predicted nucleic acid-binding protein
MAVELVFADTNLFLRYLTNDVPAQAEAVETILQRAARGEISLVSTGMIMAEIVWTLESFYKQPRKRISDMLLAILNTPGLEVVDGDLVSQAAVWFADKNVDFIDAYNVAWMARESVSSVCTFDRRHFERFNGIKVFLPWQISSP